MAEIQNIKQQFVNLNYSNQVVEELKGQTIRRPRLGKDWKDEESEDTPNFTGSEFKNSKSPNPISKPSRTFVDMSSFQLNGGEQPNPEKKRSILEQILNSKESSSISSKVESELEYLTPSRPTANRPVVKSPVID